MDPIPQLPPFPNVPGNPILPFLPGGAGSGTDFLTSTLVSSSRLITGAITKTWLSTPQLTDQGRIRNLWQGSLAIALTLFVLLIVAGGALVMTHESMQTRYALRQIAPRIVAGFIVANLSLWIMGHAIGMTNALAQAFMGQGFDVAGALAGLVSLFVIPTLINPLAGGLVFLVVALIGLVMFVGLAGTFVIRLIVTILLIVSAPLALACHASPATESAAFLWWRLFAAVLAIQLGQALGLITALRIFSNTDGRAAAGILGGDPLINAVITLCLLYVLIKIPIWAFRMALGRSGHHTPMLVRLATYMAASRLLRTSARGIGQMAAGPWGKLFGGIGAMGRAALPAGAGASGGGLPGIGARAVGGLKTRAAGTGIAAGSPSTQGSSTGIGQGQGQGPAESARVRAARGRGFARLARRPNGSASRRAQSAHAWRRQSRPGRSGPPQVSPQADAWARRVASSRGRQQPDRVAAAWRRRMAAGDAAPGIRTARGRATRRAPIVMPGQWRRGRPNGR